MALELQEILSANTDKEIFSSEIECNDETARECLFLLFFIVF